MDIVKYFEDGEKETSKNVFLNCIQMETNKILELIHNVKDSKELYKLATEEYENKVMSVYNGKSILYSKYGLIWKDIITPLVCGPVSAVFDSPVGSYILIYENIKEWDSDEELASKRHAYEFFLNHEIKHVMDYSNPFYRFIMKRAYNENREGKLNHKDILKFELRADRYALKELKKLPNKVVVRTLMFVYKFLNININQLNENIRAHREFALKFLSNGLLTRQMFELVIKQQAENRFKEAELRLDSIETRLKVIEKEIQALNPLGTITMDF